MGICFSKDRKVTDAAWNVPTPVHEKKEKPPNLTKIITKPDIFAVPPHKKLLKAFTTQSLEEVTLAIVTAWLVNRSGWSIAYDENYNVYYYTDDGQSSWDPPQVILNDDDWQSFASDITVKVPHNVTGGEIFTTSVGNVLVDVLIPQGAKPGDPLLLLAPIAPCYNEAGIIEAVIDISKVDTSMVWADLSTVADLDYGEISDDVAIAHTVLEKIANGSYTNELIFQLSWAYKVHLLETAVKDCFIRKADYFNSEMYDSCNGIPRYTERGLVEWWQDLRNMRISIEEKLTSISESLRLFGNTDIDDLFHSRNVVYMNAFETSNKDKQLAQLIERHEMLTKELDNMTAQSVAIVSIDGGPSEECVETVHNYLKDFLDRDLVIEDNLDEIDELVSNALEPRHKFVVGTVLNMVMVERQIEAIDKEIANYRRQPFQANEAVEAATEEPSAASAADEVKALIAKQESDARNLEDALLADQAAKRAALHERLANSRQSRIRDAMTENPSLTEDAASLLVDEAIRDDDRAESENIDKDMSAQLDSLHSHQLNELKKAADVAGIKLKENLENEKQKCMRDLHKRLEDQKAARKKAIQNAASGSSEEETEIAIEHAIAVVEEEISVERLELENLFVNKESDGRAEILSALKAQHDAESERLKANLSSQQEAKKRALASRLERKISARASTLVSEAVAHGEQLSLHQAMQLAGGEYEKEKEMEEVGIENATKEKMAAKRSAIVDSLKECYDKESENMKTLMTYQENLHKSNLQERLALKKKQKQAEVMRENLASGVRADAEGRVNEELAKEETELKESCNASLQAMKANYDSQIEVLQEELTHKGKKYSESLASRLQKRKQFKTNITSTSPPLVGASDEPKEQTKNVSDIISAIKHDQVNAITRLKKLITYARDHELVALAKRKGVTSAMKGSILLNFSTLMENSAIGLKKRNLYLIKSLKDYASKKETNNDVLTDTEYALLTSVEAVNKVCQEASEQLLARVGRDISGICDCHATEDNSAHAKMVEDCTPSSKMHDIQHKKMYDNKDQIICELRKGTSTLVGIWINISSLMESGEGKLENVTPKSHKAPSPSGWGDGDELEEDDSVDAYNYPLTGAIMKWITDVCSALTLCDDSISNLNLNLIGAHFKSLLMDEISDKFKLYESSLDYRKNALKYIVPMTSSTFYTKLIANNFNPIEYRKQLNAEHSKHGIGLTVVLTKDSKASDEIKKKVMHLFEVAIKDFLNTPIMQESAKKNLVKQLNANIKKLTSDSKSGTSKAEAMTRPEQLLKGLDEKLKRKKQDLKERLKRKQEQMRKSTDLSIGVLPNADDIKAIEAELQSLMAAQDTVRKIVIDTSKADKSKTLEIISVETLLLSVDKILRGDKVQSADDLLAVLQESNHVNEALQVEKIKEQQAQSGEKLDLALKMKQGKDKQQLQKRLMNRKNKA